jgi:alpha-L-arabinofuranosidase
MASAVYMADILMFMMEKSIPSEHIHAAFWHNFANGAQGLFAIHVTDEYKQVLGRPRGCQGAIEEGEQGRREPVYWTFKLLSEQHGDELVKSVVRSKNNRIEAPDNGFYWDPEFHFDRVTHLATRKGNSLYLAVLNKDANLPVGLQIDIRGWNVEASVKKYAVGAGSYLARNSLKNPDNVSLSEDTIIVNPSNMQVPLPQNTLTVLRFTRVDSR